MIHVCVPTLRRYDLLRNMLHTLAHGTLEPTAVYVIDNGRNASAVNAATDGFSFPIIVQTPKEPMGIAESWNWFLDHVPEERIITNDDVVFGPESLEVFAAVDKEKDIVWAREAGFSCFLIRDSCVKKIGVFDESISPGYGYYEDEDYAMRINRRGKGPIFASSGDVVSGVEHLLSKTFEAATPAEVAQHHRRFWLAQCNYIVKWGLQNEFAEEVKAKELGLAPRTSSVRSNLVEREVSK